MLIQEKISGADTLLKLYVAIDEDLKALQPQLQAKQFRAIRAGGRRAECGGGAHDRSVGRVAGTHGQGQSVLSRPDVSSAGVPHTGRLQQICRGHESV